MYLFGFMPEQRAQSGRDPRRAYPQVSLSLNIQLPVA